MPFSGLASDFAFYFALLPVTIFIVFRLILSWFVTTEATSSKRMTPIERILIAQKNATTMLRTRETSKFTRSTMSAVQHPPWSIMTFGKNKAEDFLVAILTAGPIPRHIAFHTDGNRRYARRNGMTPEQGYEAGFASIKRALEICFRLHVKCVTLYCFSIENFKRAKEEVDLLMKLLGMRFLEIAQPGELLDRYAARLNVLGRKELLYDLTRVQVEEAERLTQNYDQAIVNLCMPYTSRDEMTTAVETCVQAAIDHDPDDTTEITINDIDTQLMTSCTGCPPLDILLRTGGDNRLSDFLLWQCCEDTQIQFIKPFWPEFGFVAFVPAILDYQRKVWSGRFRQ